MRRLTNNSDNDFDPSWSPAGDKIIFGSTRDGDGEIYVMNPDGTNPVRLTDSIGENERPDWSPDGERILFSGFRATDYDLYVVNPDGTNEVNLTDTEDVDECYPSWQPL